MIVTGIALENYARFRGKHLVPLGPGAHALTARRLGNHESSNWCGKSSFAKAVVLALYGWHDYDLEDQWITDGEDYGCVKVSLSDGDWGCVVVRERKRGKATKLRVEQLVLTNATSHAVGDAAQELIEQRVGLSLEDFFSSCFVLQKKMASFVSRKTAPGKRMDVVAGWLRLDKLQACEAAERDSLRIAVDLVQEAEQKQRMYEESAQRIRADVEPILARYGSAALDACIRFAKAEVEATQRALDAAVDGREAALQAERDCADKAAYDALTVEGLSIRAALEASPLDEARLAYVEQRAAVEDLTGRVRVSKLNLDAKAKLALGEFDGVCPVGGIQCPARDQLNESARRNARLHREVASGHSALAEEHALAHRTERKLLAEYTELERAATRLESLRQRARVLKPAADRAVEAGTTRAAPRSEDLLAAQRAAADRLAALERAEEQLMRRADDVTIQVKRVEGLQAEASLHREALAVLKQSQRHIAEAALADIEAIGNGILARCGIDLSFAVSWSREGKDLASHCDECGTAFPSSAKAKQCARCGAQRGPNVVNRLELKPSACSPEGSAEDLVGLAFQFAAGAWLRRDRGSAWSCAFVDEPYGSLDAANLRQLSGNLAGILADCGFEQAIVVSHSPGTNEALPRRIEVVAGPEGSKVSVL